MPKNFPAGQFLRKANKCFGVCKVNWSMSCNDPEAGVLKKLSLAG
jgi:hypothetical protein